MRQPQSPLRLPLRSNAGVRRFAAALAIFLCAGAQPTVAQTTRPAGAAQPAETAANTSASAEVIAIPEFQVSTSRPRDEWFASNAMSGTRAAAAIIDLPYQVQVLTQEFLEDFQLVSLGEQMSYFPSYGSSADQADAAIGATSTGRMLRGFPQTVVRDGFRRTPPPTVGNTAQVEVIKGPVSTLYGDASPGGLINYISRKPTVRPTGKLSISGGSYRYFRSNAIASGPLYKDKLYYLVMAENYFRHGETNYTWARNGDYLLSLLFKPGPSTSISVSYEIVRLAGARAASMPYLVVNTTPTTTKPGLSWSGGTITGIDWELARARYSRFGPDEYYERDYDGLNIQAEHAYNGSWKQRVAFQGQWKSFDQKYRTSSNVSATTRRMNDVRPNRRLQDIDGPRAFQTDLIGHVKTGSLRHTLLFTADYAEEQTRDLQMRLSNQQVRDLLPDSYRYPDPYNQDWSTKIDYDVLQTIGSKGNENLVTKGGSISDRVTLADGRVIVMGNVRRDSADYDVDTTTSATDNWVSGKDSSTTYSAGINVKLLGDALVAFANRSTSFNTNLTVDRNLGTTIPNERGRGMEVGFKTVTFRQRFGATVSYFEIEKTNIGQTNPDFVLGGTMAEFLGSGRERARGVDGDFTFKVNDQLSLMGGAGYVDAKVLDSTNANLRHTRKIQVPRTTGSLSARYKCEGALKGLGFGASLRYMGDFVRANATATRLYEEGAPRQIYAAFVSYAWKQNRYRHTLQFNANNLFDKFYIGPDLNIGMGLQLNGTYTISY